ncbi:MAG: response regulator [Azonexus sp.]
MTARVLIVDDNESMRRVFSALLTQAGYQVVAALPDGNGLLAWIKRETPDIVCLDYHLPGRDGLSLLAAIDQTFPQVAVLFMTASGETSLEQRAADAGAAGFLRKPFSQTQVLAELRAVCASRQTAKQETSASAAETKRRPTAVIADDSGAVRLVLKGLLEESGVRVVQSVANGAEALNALRHHQPDLLCLDINMPVMDGIEALPQALAISPETAIVMVTGCNDRQLIGQAAGLGAKAYILKPLRPAYVEGLVRKLFRTGG